MLNKNDPLIGAVQEVMKKNQAERNAAKLVNEKFGVHDRKALPHEKQGEWDAAYKAVLTEGLHPNQQKLDVHEPEKDKLTTQDFKMLRAKKKPMEEENAPKTDPYIEGQASSISTVPQPKKEVTPADQSALKKKIQSIMKESNLQEKAVSKAQHRFFGLVRGIQKGKAHGSAKAEKAAETMSAKSVRDYAKTSEKGLPEKVSEAMDQSQIRGQSNVAGARLSGSFTTQGALPRPPRPAIDSAPRPQQASPMMGQGAPGIKKQPGGARPSVVAKNTPTTSAAAKEVAGARLSGSFTTQGALPQKPASAAKTGPSFERTGRGGSPSMAPKTADRPNDLGKAGVPGTGGKLAPAASAAAPKPVAKPVQAAKKPTAAAPVKNASTRGGTMSQSDANVLAKVKAGGGQKLSKTLPSGRERLKFFAARNAERRGP